MTNTLLFKSFNCCGKTIQCTTELEFVSDFATHLKHNATLFELHKFFLEKEMRTRDEYFRNRFGTGEEFKRNARKYLKAMGILK